jgi:type II secretory pathway component PulC
MKLARVLPFLFTTEQGFRLGAATAAFFALLGLVSFITLCSDFWSDARLASLNGARAEALQDLVSPLNELKVRIPEAHLFGHKALDAAYAPITSAQLRLTGIIQLGSEEDDNAFSKAIISVQGGIGKVYQVGDVLPEGVKLTGIQADAVLLDNNGHSERLPLQRTRLERT